MKRFMICILLLFSLSGCISLGGLAPTVTQVASVVAPANVIKNTLQPIVEDKIEKKAKEIIKNETSNIGGYLIIGLILLTFFRR